jgi:glycogen phosphorylase
MSKDINPFSFKTASSINPLYSKMAAYFSMEFAIDQSLKIYSGGLGFLSGSHMRSAYELKQNVIGIGILWSYGYYDQVRADDNSMHPQFRRKDYSFLVDTGIEFQITIHGAAVWVKAYYLEPDIFGTAPLFLLTTDYEKNDPLARTTCHKLYDSNPAAKIAQCMVLGIGGYMLLKTLGIHPHVYHMNEAHALPLIFKLFSELKDKSAVQDKVVFTTHTPEEAGNEKHLLHFLDQMGYFGNLSNDQVRDFTGIYDEIFNHSLAALRCSRKANAVSKLHGDVARQMWGEYEQICPIIHITNAQNKNFWMDSVLETMYQNNNFDGFHERKRQLKMQLFDEVADQTGKLFDPNILTIVWARRFAAYKRPALITEDMENFQALVNDNNLKIQIIWAGKPYPLDQQSIDIFNSLVLLSKNYPNVAVVTGYELKLSRLLKYGADIWLNTPIVTREASGTSGMTAAMNGGLNFSTDDGWICEFAKHGENAFVMPKASKVLSAEERDDFDRNSFFKIMKHEVLPLYYSNKNKWNEMCFTSINNVLDYFESGRMAQEYYQNMY